MWWFVKKFFNLIRICIFPKNLEEFATAFTIYSIPFGILFFFYYQ